MHTMDDLDLSPYERSRLANIEANRAELQKLGLAPKLPAVNRATRRRRAAADSNAGLSSLSRRSPRASTAAAPSVPLRRSLRTRSSVTYALIENDLDTLIVPPSVDTTGNADMPDEQQQAEFWARRAREAPSADADPDGKPLHRTHRPSSAASATAPSSGGASSKELTADVAGLLKLYLGRPIPKLGTQVKRAVMEAAAPGRHPRFNRMSGIQEWLNAVFLFVNISEESYANTFLDQGQAVTWFAQPTQTADTPVVQRLLRCGVAAAQAQKLQCHCRHVSTSSQSDTESAPILLFCRLPDEPYVCFGRLALRDCDLTTRPLRFLWHLADVDVLRRELPSFAEFIGSPEAAKTSA